MTASTNSHLEFLFARQFHGIDYIGCAPALRDDRRPLVDETVVHSSGDLVAGSVGARSLPVNAVASPVIVSAKDDAVATIASLVYDRARRCTAGRPSW